MKGIFSPRSVAVVGVSAKPDNLGRNIMLNLIDFGFDGIVYPVGPSGKICQTLCPALARKSIKLKASLPRSPMLKWPGKAVG